MKKIVCLALVLFALLGCLTACNYTQNLSGALAGMADATPKAEEMMALLADGNISSAKALIHPSIAESLDSAISQMSSYLAGRKVNTMELISIKVNTSSGTSGATRQEQVGYQVTLNDGAVIYINAVYLSDKEGAGFTSFQLVLGIV